MGRDSGGGGDVRAGGGGSRLARLLVLEKENEEREEREEEKKLRKRERGLFQRLGARLRGSFRKLRSEMVGSGRGEDQEKSKRRGRGRSEEDGSEMCESEIQPSGRDSAYFSLNMSLSEEEEEGEEMEEGSCLDVREGSVSPGVGRCSDILVGQIREPGRDPPRALGTRPYGCTRDLPFGLHLQGPHPVRLADNTFSNHQITLVLLRFESLRTGLKPQFQLGHQVAALQVFVVKMFSS